MRVRLNQKAVYWSPSSADSFGRPTVATPVQLSCRWEDGFHDVINASGDTVTSAATVYLLNNVFVGGLLFLGTLADLGSNFPTDPRQDRRVHEIIAKGNVPSLRGTQTLTNAHLV